MIKRLKNIASYLYPIIVEQSQGKVSPYLEVNLSNGKYTLDTSKVNYSYGSLYKIFDQTFNDFNLKSREVKSALILGFGAGSVASLLTEKYSIGAKITGVEKDEVVIDLAHKYFDIGRFKKMELICDDAYTFVHKNNKTFDVIVVDIYVDEELPKCFHEKEFLKQLDRLLQSNGVLFFNKVVNNQKEKAEFNELTANIEEIFGNSLIYKLTRNGTNNHMLIHDRTSIADSNSVLIKGGKCYNNKIEFVTS